MKLKKPKKQEPEIIEADETIYDVDAEEAKLQSAPIPMEVGYTGKSAPVVSDDEELESGRNHTRIVLSDIEDDKVYGVRCMKRRAFGQATYPAMGWEIRRYHPHHFDYGAISVFLSSRSIPKGYLLMKVDASGSGASLCERFIALRYWTNSDPHYYRKETAARSFRLRVQPPKRLKLVRKAVKLVLRAKKLKGKAQTKGKMPHK